MKNKFKIINLLIVIGFAMGCSDQLETENLSEFSTVTKSEAIQFLSNRNFKNSNNYIKNVDIDALKSELIANSDQELLVAPVQTADEGYSSRIVMLKVNNEVKAKVVHYLKKDEKSTSFTGEVILSDLEGHFYGGGWFENNLLTSTYTFREDVAGKTDSAECRQSCGHSADNEYCVCNTQNLSEVVIVASKPTPYVSISTIYQQELDGGNSGCEVECGGWPPGGGSTSGSNSTPSCGANEELDSDKKNCICKEGYTRNDLNECIKKPCPGNPIAGGLHVAPQKGKSGAVGGMFGNSSSGGCTRYGGTDCSTTKNKSHNGIDLKSSYGDPIFAMYDGFIYSTKYDSDGAGYYTRIQTTINGETFITSYFHLQKENRILQTSSPLTYVKAGDIIGYQGDSGNLKMAISGGTVESHLHIEVSVHNGSSSWAYKNFDLVDPRDYFHSDIDDNGNSTNNTNCN